MAKSFLFLKGSFLESNIVDGWKIVHAINSYNWKTVQLYYIEHKHVLRMLRKQGIEMNSAMNKMKRNQELMFDPDAKR